MTLRFLLRLLPLLATLALPAVALASKESGPKARIMAKYDLNKNGKLDPDEMAAIRKDFAADPSGELKKYDTDGDGKLSDDEIAKMVPGSGKKSGAKKAKAADSESKDEADKPTAPAPAPAPATPAAATPPPPPTK